MTDALEETNARPEVKSPGPQPVMTAVAFLEARTTDSVCS